MDMEAKLESIIAENDARRATAMAALTHLRVFRSEAPKFGADDARWFERRSAMEARFVALVRELAIPVKAPLSVVGAFDLVPA